MGSEVNKRPIVAPEFIGEVTGDVTGNVTGDVTGSVEVESAEAIVVDPNATVEGLDQTIKVEFDAATINTIGTHDLGVTLPDNAVILDGMVDVITTFTSATDAATIALQAEAANDLVTAIAISDVSNPWDAGLKAIKPLGTAATAIKTTAAKMLKVVIGAEDLTAGKLVLILRYVVTE